MVYLPPCCLPLLRHFLFAPPPIQVFTSHRLCQCQLKDASSTARCVLSSLWSLPVITLNSFPLNSTQLHSVTHPTRLCPPRDSLLSIHFPSPLYRPTYASLNHSSHDRTFSPRRTISTIIFPHSTCFFQLFDPFTPLSVPCFLLPHLCVDITFFPPCPRRVFILDTVVPVVYSSTC